MKISVITPTIRGDKGLERPRQSLKNNTFKDYEWIIERHDPKDPPDFNAAMNRAIKKAKGELIVFLQDYIKIPSWGLRKFWKAYDEELNVFWTSPVGKTLDDQLIEWDWRKHASRDCNFMEWEIDWAAAPKNALVEIGGFDEKLDKHWGFDNVNVGFRAVISGYKIKCLSENFAVAYDHNEVMEHPYQKLRSPNFHNERLDEIRLGKQIKYL